MSAPRLNPNLFSASAKANLARQKNFFEDSTTKAGGEADINKHKIPARRKATLTPADAPSLVRTVKVSPDKNDIRIVLAIDPATIPTAQGKGAFVDKSGRVHFFTKPKQRKAEKAFEVALLPYAHLSRSWGNVPVEVELDMYFNYPSGTPKKHLHKIGPHTQRPDVDNIAKGNLDAMTRAGYWMDDSYINTLILRKRRTTGQACIVIKIVNLRPKFEALYVQAEEFDSPTLFNRDAKLAKPSETNPLSDLAQT